MKRRSSHKFNLKKTLIILPFISIIGNEMPKVDPQLLSLFRGEEVLISKHSTKQKAMGISINLYRTKKAERFEDLKDIERQIVKTSDTKVDLYKFSPDLGMVFMNSMDPFGDGNTIACKILYGSQHVEKDINNFGTIGGFLPSSGVIEVVKWIKSHKLETYEGFSKMYDGLSVDVKKALGPNTKAILYNDYIKPLVAFYLTAHKNGNSVVYIGL